MFLSPFFQNKFPQFLDFSKIELTELHVKKIKLRRQYTQKISKANPLKPTK